MNKLFSRLLEHKATFCEFHASYQKLCPIKWRKKKTPSSTHIDFADSAVWHSFKTPKVQREYMGGSVVGNEMLSFHKDSQLHQPLAWLPVSACFTSGSVSLSRFPSLLLKSALPLSSLWGLFCTQWHPCGSLPSPHKVNIYSRVSSMMLLSLWTTVVFPLFPTNYQGTSLRQIIQNELLFRQRFKF